MSDEDIGCLGCLGMLFVFVGLLYLYGPAITFTTVGTLLLLIALIGSIK